MKPEARPRRIALRHRGFPRPCRCLSAVSAAFPSVLYYDLAPRSSSDLHCRGTDHRRIGDALRYSGRFSVRPRPVSLAELGCGSGEKIALLASAAGDRFPLIQLIDISQAALDMARYRLEAIGMRAVLAHHVPYEQGIVLAAQQRPRDGSLVMLFLGSNIGNFRPRGADFSPAQASLRPGDALLWALIRQTEREPCSRTTTLNFTTRSTVISVGGSRSSV